MMHRKTFRDINFQTPKTCESQSVLSQISESFLDSIFLSILKKVEMFKYAKMDGFLFQSHFDTFKKFKNPTKTVVFGSHHVRHKSIHSRIIPTSRSNSTCLNLPETRTVNIHFRTVPQYSCPYKDATLLFFGKSNKLQRKTLHCK